MNFSKHRRSREVLTTNDVVISRGEGSRWWENYLVRYLVGTVIGAGCVWILTQTLRPDMAVPDVLNPKVVGQSNYLLILAICGFAYCYVASQLVLVVHVWRFSIEFRWKRKDGDYKKWKHGKQSIAFVASLVITGSLGWLSNMLLAGATNPMVFGWLLAVGFIGVQYFMCFYAFLHHRHLYDFYEALARARAHVRKDGAELIDSYRHMREHGNALFILLAEIMFLGYLVGCQYAICGAVGHEIPSLDRQVSLAALFAILWIVPGAAVWFLATSVEHRFCNWDYARYCNERC